MVFYHVTCVHLPVGGGNFSTFVSVVFSTMSIWAEDKDVGRNIMFILMYYFEAEYFNSVSSISKQNYLSNKSLMSPKHNNSIICFWKILS